MNFSLKKVYPPLVAIILASMLAIAQSNVSSAQQSSPQGSNPTPSSSPSPSPSASANANTNPSITGGNLTPGQITMVLSNSEAVNFIQHNNNKEVQEAQAAQNKLQNAQLKNVNQQLLQDHQSSSGDVQTAAQSLGIAIPSFQLATHEQAQSNLLNQLNGTQFDQAYLDAEKSDHAMAIQTLQSLQSSVKDQQVLNLISTAMSLMQKHLTALSNISL